MVYCWLPALTKGLLSLVVKALAMKVAFMMRSIFAFSAALSWSQMRGVCFTMTNIAVTCFSCWAG